MQKNEIRPYHIIGAFLHFLKGNKIKKDTAAISWFIYKLKKKHPELEGMKKIYFRYIEGDFFPLCSELESYWSLLKYTKVLKDMGDLDRHYLWIDNGDKDSFGEDFRLFSEEGRKIIHDCVSDFNKQLGCEKDVKGKQ